MRSAADRERGLVAAAGAGDETAFTELVAPHREALVRFVARRSGRGELAEDAVQEALVSAHRALRDGQRPSDVRAWLHTIAWRRALDLVRRERDTVPLECTAATAAVAGPDSAVQRAGELESIVLHWLALPDRQREALVLSVFEGRSLRDIAVALGVTETAAKSLVARGRRTLLSRVAAGDLSCDAARPQVLAAAERGVRLRGEVHRHVRGCRACARLHRSARMRRRLRAVLVLPVGTFDRLRDLVYVGAAHEPQVSLATKLCATACAATLAGGAGGATLATTAPVVPLGASLATTKADGRAKQERRKESRRAPRRPSPSPVRTAPVQSAPAPVAAAPARRAPAPAPVATAERAPQDDAVGVMKHPGAVPPGSYPQPRLAHEQEAAAPLVVSAAQSPSPKKPVASGG